MDMVPVYEDEAAAAESPIIDVDPVTIQNMGIRTALVTRGPLRRTIRTVGAIDYDETALADVTTKFKGWIEKLYVDATGKQLSSRRSAVRNLFARTLQRANGISAGARISREPIDARRTRLRTARSTKLQVLRHFRRANRRTGTNPAQPSKTLAHHCAPQDGFVVEKMVVRGPDGGCRHEALPAGRPRHSSGCRRRSTSRTCRSSSSGRKRP